MEEVDNERKMEEWVRENNPRPHKIPVPTQYRQAAKILKQIVEDGKSFKELVYNNKHIVRQNINQADLNLMRHLIVENWKYGCTFKQDPSKRVTA